MKTALITTTINVPHVLSLYRVYDPNVMFFVAGDIKTAYDAEDFCGHLANCVYLTTHKQKRWKHSELIGWNTDSRRNIALLEAMKWGADIIVSIDDDMICTENPFSAWQKLFVRTVMEVNYYGHAVHKEETNPFNGIQFGIPNRWFSHGALTTPPARERGIPFDHPIVGQPGFVIDAQIGVAQGIILGVPDTDAANAIVARPMIYGATDILRQGFVAHPQCKCVFNSQFTAFRAELAPAFAQFYFAQGRNTDILAAMLMRRIMREKNLYTYYGPPMAFHARSDRPLFNDLKAEMYGLEVIDTYADYLNRAPLPAAGRVLDWCRILAEGWKGPELEAAMAFYDDCESLA